MFVGVGFSLPHVYIALCNLMVCLHQQCATRYRIIQQAGKRTSEHSTRSSASYAYLVFRVITEFNLGSNIMREKHVCEAIICCLLF